MQLASKHKAIEKDEKMRSPKIDPKYWNYTEDQLIEAVKDSTTLSDVMRKLEEYPVGGSFKTTRKRIEFLNLDISHFTGRAHMQGKSGYGKKPVIEFLYRGCKIRTTTLKEKLINEKYFERKCYSCNLTMWLTGLIPLELDHVDGDTENNCLENLTLLCPNCHALTPTYRAKNRKFRAERIKKQNEVKN